MPQPSNAPSNATIAAPATAIGPTIRPKLNIPLPNEPLNDPHCFLVFSQNVESSSGSFIPGGKAGPINFDSLPKLKPLNFSLIPLNTEPSLSFKLSNIGPIFSVTDDIIGPNTFFIPSPALPKIPDTPFSNKFDIPPSILVVPLNTSFCALITPFVMDTPNPPTTLDILDIAFSVPPRADPNFKANMDNPRPTSAAVTSPILLVKNVNASLSALSAPSTNDIVAFCSAYNPLVAAVSAVSCAVSTVVFVNEADVFAKSSEFLTAFAAFPSILTPVPNCDPSPVDITALMESAIVAL